VFVFFLEAIFLGENGLILRDGRYKMISNVQNARKGVENCSKPGIFNWKVLNLGIVKIEQKCYYYYVK